MNMKVKVGHYYLIPYIKNKKALAICIKARICEDSNYGVFQLLQQEGWYHPLKGIKNCWNASENLVKEIPKEQVVLYLLKEE